MTLFTETALIARTTSFNRLSEKAQIRIFVADDHPLILTSIKLMFERLPIAGTDVTGFTAISELESALGSHPAPDLVLIDFDMPGLATVEKVADFINRHHDVRIAILSGQTDSQLARTLMDRGCLGFVPKTLSPNVIYHAVRLMIGGTRFVPDLRIGSMPSGVNAGAATDLRPAFPASPPDTRLTDKPSRQRNGLTPREIDVLQCLAHGNTNKEIARQLKIEEVTVKLHLRHAYGKLGVRNRIQAIRAILEGTLEGVLE